MNKQVEQYNEFINISMAQMQTVWTVVVITEGTEGPRVWGSGVQGWSEGIGKMRNCGMRKVKWGIQKCGNVCGMVGKTRNAERTVCKIDRRI